MLSRLVVPESRGGRNMVFIPSLLLVAVHSLLADARLDMTVIGSPIKLASTEGGDYVNMYCYDVLSADGDIVQEFGRVIDTGTGATGSGASGPSDYGSGPPSYASVPANSGLPSGSNINNDNTYLGQYLVMPDYPSPVERVGVFYCDTNSTDERNDHTRIQLIMLAENAVVKPVKTTVTINAGESVMLEMQATNGNTSLRWLFNGSPLAACDNQSSCNVSSAGIYECYYDGQHNLGIHGITRVIVRDCPAEMWDPSSGCDKVCLDCINGGVCDDKIGDCVCPPGFMGTHCQETCEFNYVGVTCGLVSAYAFDIYCLPDPYGCSCGTGHYGMSCEPFCDDGHFGAGCTQDCHCTTSGCDMFTGKCNFGDCTLGWSGPNCQYRAPSIVSFTNKKVNSGEQTTFTCVIEASPRPLASQVSIKQSDSNINFNFALDPDNGWLMVTSDSVTVNIGESYTCTVSNSALAGGIFTTIPVDLFVPPTLLNGPDISGIGSTQVAAIWSPWYQDFDLGDGPVSMYRVYYRLATQSDFTLFGETTETSLTVTGLKENKTYQFAITAYRDIAGWGDYSPPSLATTFPYLPPTLVNGPVIDIGMTRATVRWTPWFKDIDLGDGPVSMYRVYYGLATQSMPTLFGETTATSLTVTGLQDNATYYFAVTAYSDATGWGDYSPSTRATLCSIPGPVLNLEASKTTADSVYLTWQQPLGASCIPDYIVGYELTNRDMCQPLTGVSGATTVGGSATSFNYMGLEPYSEYIMKVEVDGGNGDVMSLKITTKESVPTGSPTEVEMVSQGPQNIGFSWKPVDCGKRHGRVTNYYYQIENTDTAAIVEEGSIPVEKENKTFDNLNTQQSYMFTIRASTSMGAGEYSQPLSILLIDAESQMSPFSEAGVIGVLVLLLVVIIVLISIILLFSLRHGYLCEKKNSPEAGQTASYKELEKHDEMNPY